MQTARVTCTTIIIVTTLGLCAKCFYTGSKVVGPKDGSGNCKCSSSPRSSFNPNLSFSGRPKPKIVNQPLKLPRILLVVLSVILGVVEFDKEFECVSLLWQHMIGYLIVIVASLLLELMISLTALRGSILDTEQRSSIPGLIYIRLVILAIEIVWLVIGGMWISRYYRDCPISTAKEAMLGLVICSWFVILSFFITLWCTFDPAGRSWVKMMNYQRSMKASESRFQYRRSGSCTRTWRHRKVLRAYQNSWDQRCRLLFCCMRHSDRSQNSFGDIARLLSDFFRDIDVVPSDVVAGLILLRKYQKIEREAIVKQRLNDTYEYLSGVAVTSETQFLPLNDPVYYGFFQDVIHYMTFALGAYGWPMCSCFSCFRPSSDSNSATIIKDNCCRCNYEALMQQVETKDVKIVYATFHVDVGITPFFVAVDYSRQKIIISIRGTLSLQDVITDLNAEGEPIPINPPKEDWLGHTGMIQVAVHIQKKLVEESILEQAFNFNIQKGTPDFKLVVVGHSLGAGAAAILSILLRQHYPDVICFSYSPPGGTLSLPAVEYTKSFITSVVVGKDVVPRIGLHQMESLRADLMHAIKRSKDPKWKTISCSVICCGCTGLPTSAQELKADDSMQLEYKKDKNKAREFVYHSQTSNVALTSHQPLYPPGRIIHVVRHHTTREEQRYETKWRQVLPKRKPVYQALWANNTDFDEVLISPVMIQDHMPENVLAALHKVIQYYKERSIDRMKQMTVAPISMGGCNPPNGPVTQPCPEYVNEFEKLFFCQHKNAIVDQLGANGTKDAIITCRFEGLDDDDEDGDESNPDGDYDSGECDDDDYGDECFDEINERRKDCTSGKSPPRKGNALVESR
ncbi:hypothetical protein RUM43_001462 [Polyplax serrata]|uniref:Diacylglycerol lipase-alpha n=1 Tax=Polyplax serrata TaxID=468196 RepID=A0AAN8SG99_POLSC